MIRRRSTWWAIAGLVAGAVLTPIACSYLALPGGWTINFPGLSGDPIPAAEIAERLSVPDGFTIGEWATGVENARFLRFTPAGDLLVSAPRQGRVFLLERDARGDGRTDGTRVLLEGLSNPHGLALHDGWLYVAESESVLRVRFDPRTRAVSGTPEPVVSGLPAGGNHWTRTIGFGPDGRLYVSIGSSCNVCIEKDRRRAAIVSYAPDGSDEKIVATGLRNAVGFAWRPGTGELWATDNGRDLLGDDFPPCELNRIAAGGFYGWPFANGDRIPDPDYGKGREAEIAGSIPPTHGFAAHTAPLGITFYDYAGPGGFPEPWRNAAFVAQHGSWNRSRKIGYQVVALFFAPDGSVREEPFATGFMVGEKTHGRPVDVAVGPDGALYVSDDFTGTIYRIAYTGRTADSATPRAGTASAGAPGAPAGKPADIPAGVPASDVGGVPAGAPADPLSGLGATERTRAEASGAELWAASDCARCHVLSSPPAPETVKPLESLSRKYTIDSLVLFLRSPQPPMPAFPFSDAERRDLAIYLLARDP